jgi:hypothetical protein
LETEFLAEEAGARDLDDDQDLQVPAAGRRPRQEDSLAGQDRPAVRHHPGADPDEPLRLLQVECSDIPFKAQEALLSDRADYTTRESGDFEMIDV